MNEAALVHVVQAKAYLPDVSGSILKAQIILVFEIVQVACCDILQCKVDILIIFTDIQDLDEVWMLQVLQDLTLPSLLGNLLWLGLLFDSFEGYLILCLPVPCKDDLAKGTSSDLGFEFVVFLDILHSMGLSEVLECHAALNTGVLLHGLAASIQFRILGRVLFLVRVTA